MPHMTIKSREPEGAIKQAEDRLAYFQSEVDDEPWKRDHLEAMRCLTFETTLRFGVGLFDFFIRVDEAMRDAFLRGQAKYGPGYDKKIRSLFQWWLRPCAKVEGALRSFEARGYEVEHAQEFRRRYAEAEWMIRSARDAFDHPRMIQLRDAAIDSNRRGETSVLGD